MALPTYVTRVEITTTSSTNNLSTAAFTTTGSNRALFVLPALRATGTTVSSLSRSTDTFASSGVSADPSGVFVNMWASTNEPVAASTALTTTLSAAVTVWGVHVLVMSDVDQTTRFEGAVANADTDATDGLTSLTVASGSTNNLVMDYLAVRSNTGDPSAAGSQTDRGGFTASTLKSRVSTLPGTGGNVSMGWGNIASPADFVAHMGWAVRSASVPPVNTVPDETVGIQTTSASARVIADIGPATPISVVDAAGLTTCRVYCTSGDLTVTLSGDVVISSGANGSSDLTLGSGASTAEFNTVLATLTYQGDADFHGKDTINVVSTGTGGSDTDSFYVLNDPYGFSVSGSHNDVVATMATLTATLPVGQTSDTVTVTATDGGAQSDSQVITLMVNPSIGDGFLPLTPSTRGLTDVIL